MLLNWCARVKFVIIRISIVDLKMVLSWLLLVYGFQGVTSQQPWKMLKSKSNLWIVRKIFDNNTWLLWNI